MSKKIINFIRIIEDILDTKRYKYILKVIRPGFNSKIININNFIVIHADNKLIMQIISDNHYYVKIADKDEYGKILCKFILYAIYKNTYIPIYNKDIYVNLNIPYMTNYDFNLDEDIHFNFYLYNTKHYSITLPTFVISEYLMQKLLYKKILKIINIDQ